MSQPNIDAIANSLRERLAHLLRRVGNIEQDLRSAHDRDWPERATELENDDVLEGLDEMSREEVRQIRQALTRIKAGRYGVCAECGEPIGPARLAAIPTAVLCRECGRRTLL